LPARRINKYVRQQEKQAYYELDIAGDVCAQFSTSLPIATVADSATAVGVVRFLANEAGFTPTIVVINDDPPREVRETILSRLDDLKANIKPKVVFEVDNYELNQQLATAYYRVILASSQERFAAQEENQIHLSISYPAFERLVVNDTYAGYGGGIALLEDFLTKFIMPY
jgi:nitrogenase molybdenum-iron protein beta chain